MHTPPLLGPSPVGAPRAAATLDAGHVARPQTGAPTAQRVEAAINDVNKALTAINATLQFEIDPETKMTVIKVVDADTNTVLRQIPNQEILDIAQALDRAQGLLIRQRA